MGGVMFDWLRRSRMGLAESPLKTADIKLLNQLSQKRISKTDFLQLQKNIFAITDR